MLIGTFKIKVNGELHAHHGFDNGLVADAGIEPDIKNVVRLFKFGTSAIRTPESLGEQLLDVFFFFEPRVGPFFLDDLREMFNDLNK